MKNNFIVGFLVLITSTANAKGGSRDVVVDNNTYNCTFESISIHQDTSSQSVEVALICDGGLPQTRLFGTSQQCEEGSELLSYFSKAKDGDKLTVTIENVYMSSSEGLRLYHLVKTAKLENRGLELDLPDYCARSLISFYRIR